MAQQHLFSLLKISLREGRGELGDELDGGLSLSFAFVCRVDETLNGLVRVLLLLEALVRQKVGNFELWIVRVYHQNVYQK